ncbi:adenylyltransferase and sulfurtransferase [Alteribacillus persepolensis]|uniref:Adenylyltransferase and sulfurtransferase n=1 Tax=Alteribacillus persepolensis TaxID=568899 RepID=A0A1G8ABA5_9BACI|nr:ThiF family adenylyltransferase [Alteribacillus persepolensis]SDH18228.1 adenylyltransferase and sulfurtransferase [Alteribacillus persepolensis]
METRYSRQERFPGIGKGGQKKLKDKHVLILGAGALGSTGAETLVRAGVGKLTIVDRDVVELSNLHRQQLYSEEDIRKHQPKAVAAKTRLQQINSDTAIKAYVLDAHAGNLKKLVRHCDLIIDGSDNYDIRFIINDLSQQYQIPWIFAAFAGSFGMTYTFLPKITPCLRCLLPALPADSMSCETNGIITPVVLMTSAHQMTEALKVLTKQYDKVRNTLLFFDVWKNEQQSIRVNSARKEKCPSCGPNRTYPYLVQENNMKLNVLCGRNTVQIRPAETTSCNLTSLANTLKNYGEVKRNKYLLLCTINNYRFSVFKDGRVLIHGTNEARTAKHLYQQFISSGL